MTQPPALARLLACASLMLAGCHETDLYAATGDDPIVPDRISLVGQLCTEDTTGDSFPVKVLFMLDSTLDMFAADQQGQRFAATGAGVRALINRYRLQQHVRFGFVGVAGTSQAYPLTGGQRFYHPNDPEIDLAVLALQQTPLPGQRDLDGAIGQMGSFIEADMDRARPGEVLRSRYLVYFLMAGPPSSSDVADLAQQVEQVKTAVYARGALEFRVHVGYVYYGQQTVTGTASTAACLLPGGAPNQPCSCAGGMSGDLGFCQVYCQVTNPAFDETRNVRARNAYTAMTTAGDGLFTEFACANSMSVNLEIAGSGVTLVKKDIVAFNMSSRLTASGPAADSDGDGTVDVEEIRFGTDPTNWDTDGDGIGDWVERRTSPWQDPLDPTDRPASCPDPAIYGVMPDSDFDLLNDCEEGLLQTKSAVPDTDGDGLPDWLEFASGTVPTSADDRLLDPDGDGLPNAKEVLEHLNPNANDVGVRAIEGYRNRVTPLGAVPVASVGPFPQLPAVVFRRELEPLVPGQGYLRIDTCERTIEFSDARYLAVPRYQPAPTYFTETGTYTTFASSPDGDTFGAEFYVVTERLPACGAQSEIVLHPLVSVSNRNCYDVRLSNIKLSETLPANGGTLAGLNRVLVFFTQAPEDRLSAPGISRVAEVRVAFRCGDPSDLSTCARSPPGGPLPLFDTDFVSVGGR